MSSFNFVVPTARNVALTNTSSAISADPGKVFGWNFINPNATPVYVKFYNIATAVVGTTVPVRVVFVPGSSVAFLPTAEKAQISFDVASSMACVTGIADANTTAPAVAVYAEVYYV